MTFDVLKMRAFEQVRRWVSTIARCIRSAELVLALGLGFTVACTPPAFRGPSSEEGPTDWNASAIRWRDYDAGMAEARASGKPVVLILYTDWCPHCHNYSRVFYADELEKLASAFVMIRVERDGHPDISARYDLDGDYVPRTFFLAPSGVLQVELQSDNPEYRYFLDEHEPDELIGLMRRALSG